MVREDIIYKEFEGFKFNSDELLKYTPEHERYIGKKFKVINLHHRHNQYAKVKFEDDYTLYYPTDEIIQKLIEADKPVEEIYIEVKKILIKIHRSCH